MSKLAKWFDAFLEFKNEAAATRKFALGAVVVITIGLACLSVTGIAATATWTLWSALPIVFLMLAVVGAEALATVAFIRTLTAPTRMRKVAGALIFLGLAAVGVHNAENGAHVVWPDRFAVSSGKLAAEAALAGEEAATLGKAQEAAIGNTGAELERVRKEIADLRVEQQLMASMSPEGISKAQSLLLAQGLYFGSVDGIRQDKTESAMRARGEAIQGELANLKAREDGLMQGQASPVQQANTDKRMLQIDNADKAAAAFWAWFWLIVMLCTLEGARSLSLWALITDIQTSEVDLDRQRAAEISAQEHANTMAALKTMAIVTPPPPIVTPPVSITEPPEKTAEIIDTPVSINQVADSAEIPPPAPPVERSDASQLARHAAKSLHKQRRADALEDVILVDDNRERNAERLAAKDAAQ